MTLFKVSSSNVLEDSSTSMEEELIHKHDSLEPPKSSIRKFPTGQEK